MTSRKNGPIEILKNYQNTFPRESSDRIRINLRWVFLPNLKFRSAYTWSTVFHGTETLSYRGPKTLVPDTVKPG